MSNESAPVISDENREVIRRVIQRARWYLDQVEFGLVNDTPGNPMFDVVWKNLNMVSTIATTAGNLVACNAINQVPKGEPEPEPEAELDPLASQVKEFEDQLDRLISYEGPTTRRGRWAIELHVKLEKFASTSPAAKAAVQHIIDALLTEVFKVNDD